MRKVHPEFAYQSRELEGQIDGILGDPPDRKNYKLMVDALVSEYASGGGIEDVNMLAFALVDHIAFNDPKGLLAEAEDYEFGDPARVFGMASCSGEAAEKMYAALQDSYRPTTTATTRTTRTRPPTTSPRCSTKMENKP